MLSFIFSHFNAVMLVTWVLFLMIVATRFFRPAWFKNISFQKPILVAAGFHIFFASFITWGQYYVWSVSSNITQKLIDLPLSKEGLLPSYLEWSRQLVFNKEHGYFLYYVLGRVWLYVFLLFALSGFLYALFKIWERYRGGFQKQGPELLFLLMLVSGWPGIIVFIPAGFILSVLLFAFHMARGKKVIDIEPTFLFAAFVALLFSRVILSFL